jgi:site-specific recombinase XerD
MKLNSHTTETMERTKADIGDLPAFQDSFIRHLRATNRSEATLTVYTAGLKAFYDHLVAKGMPKDVLNIHREHLEPFISLLIAAKSPATAATRFTALRSFFNWLVDEDEIPDTPMRRMKLPKVPLKMVPLISNEDLSRLFKTCDGPSFEDRRDAAILRLLLDTGLRRSEIANILYSRTDDRLSDVNIQQGHIKVMGKGGKERIVAFGAKSAKALDRYLRRRDSHPLASSESLWIGQTGHLTADGVECVLDKRAKMAGIGHIHLHQFRHTFAHLFLAAGGQETQLMKLTGWSTRTMLERYAAIGATDRAIAAHRQFSPGDQI